MHLLLALFILVPVIEIALFIQVGGWLGIWPTLALVVITAIIGTWLVRTQGLATFARLQNNMAHLQDPSNALAHGAMILFSGALLLTPGFFTDIFGFLLLAPKFREWAFDMMKQRLNIKAFDLNTHTMHTSQSSEQTVEGTYETYEAHDTAGITSPSKTASNGSSGWTKR